MIRGNIVFMAVYLVVFSSLVAISLREHFAETVEDGGTTKFKWYDDRVVAHKANSYADYVSKANTNKYSLEHAMSKELYAPHCILFTKPDYLNNGKQRVFYAPEYVDPNTIETKTIVDSKGNVKVLSDRSFRIREGMDVRSVILPPQGSTMSIKSIELLNFNKKTLMTLTESAPVIKLKEMVYYIRFT